MSDSQYNVKDMVSGGHQAMIEKPLFLKLKTERLLSVIYLITDYLSDKDPIKWQLRSLAFQLYSIIYDLYTQSDKDDSLSFKGQINSFSLVRKINKLIDLISIVITSGSVSQMNFALVQKEYVGLKQIIENLFTNSNWNRQMLVDETIKLSKGQYTFGQKNNHGENMSHKKLSDMIHKTKISNNHATNRIKNHTTTKFSSKNIRKNKIREFLQGRGWSSIKDIISILPGYSSKTIQRELNNLVVSNVLKKKGQKRWSRYALLEQ